MDDDDLTFPRPNHETAVYKRPDKLKTPFGPKTTGRKRRKTDGDTTEGEQKVPGSLETIPEDAAASSALPIGSTVTAASSVASPTVRDVVLEAAESAEHHSCTARESVPQASIAGSATPSCEDSSQPAPGPDHVGLDSCDVKESPVSSPSTQHPQTPRVLPDAMAAPEQESTQLDASATTGDATAPKSGCNESQSQHGTARAARQRQVPLRFREYSLGDSIPSQAATQVAVTTGIKAQQKPSTAFNRTQPGPAVAAASSMTTFENMMQQAMQDMQAQMMASMEEQKKQMTEALMKQLNITTPRKQ